MVHDVRGMDVKDAIRWARSRSSALDGAVSRLAAVIGE